MLADFPRLLSHRVGVLAHVEPQLAVWSISERSSETSSFQSKLQSLPSSHGGQRQISLMAHSLGDGIAGVWNRVQIPFQDR